MKHHLNNHNGLTREIGPFSATALIIANMIREDRDGHQWCSSCRTSGIAG